MGRSSLKSTHSLSDTGFWIRCLLVLLVVANLLVFVVYVFSQTETNVAALIWEYLKSDPFKAITISIVLPIILFLLENLFEVRKTHQDRLFEANKIRQQREEKEMQEGLAKRWKVVKQTEKTFNNLVSLSEELISLGMDYYKDDDSGKCSKKQYIGDFIKRLSICINSWTELVNKWRYYFPNLEGPAQDVKFSKEVACLVNVLSSCFETVALYYLKCENAKDKKRAKELQLDLLPILWGVRSYLYHPMMSILKDSITVYSKTTEEETVKKRIAENLASLKAKNDSLQREEMPYCPFFCQLKNERSRETLFEAFRKAEAASEDKFKDTLDELIKQVQKADREDLMRAIQIPCSLEWLDHLANRFLYEKITRELESRRDLKN